MEISTYSGKKAIRVYNAIKTGLIEGTSFKSIDLREPKATPIPFPCQKDVT